ncbi:MAG: cysteine desulfurase family protein [bacterium]|nr:cysteine desulfurase family protein [bacterium]
MIYLDAAATAEYKKIDDIIVDTITESMKKYWRNPSSLYSSDIKEEIDRCRKNIAAFIGANPEEIIFTSGASESNNFAIRGWVDQQLMKDIGMINIITTPIEHKSILESVNNPSLGACVRYCDVDRFGFVDYNHLEKLLWFREKEPTLVSIGMANNEIGTIQDIKIISKLVHEYGGIIHVDATQAFGHIPINVEELGIDMMSASGHKISPVLKGIGFLYKKNGINIQPLIRGSQENGFRGGTENTFGIIGLSKAIEYCDVSSDKIEQMCKKRDYFISLLQDKPGRLFNRFKFNCRLNGSQEHRLPNNINITFNQNITGESLLYTLDMSGIKISTGSACNSHSIVPSYVLKAIGLTDEESMRTVRFSLSNDITYDDINFAVNEIKKAIKIIET